MRSDDCPKLEIYLLATLPGAESIAVTDDLVSEQPEVLEGSQLRSIGGVFYLDDPALVKSELEETLIERIEPDQEHSRLVADEVVSEPSDLAFKQAVFDELLRGKLTFEQIADTCFGTLDQVQAIANEMLSYTGGEYGPALSAIIADRLTPSEAALRFGKHKSNISRAMRGFREKWR